VGQQGALTDAATAVQDEELGPMGASGGLQHLDLSQPIVERRTAFQATHLYGHD
jgi:hypothetical protein